MGRTYHHGEWCFCYEKDSNKKPRIARREKRRIGRLLIYLTIAELERDAKQSSSQELRSESK